MTGSELVKEIIRTLETLGKYERVVQVHEGGSAFSFKAHQKLLGRDSFIKIYDYIEGQEDSVLAEPRQLVDILRSGPKSEHIIDIYDVDILEVAGEKFVCLQMEYCQGESLLSFLRSNYLGQQDAIRIITQIVDGVSYLHTKKILHRDIKPSNIMICDGKIKIVDLGSAAKLDDTKGYVSASKHSVLYVPPEGFEHPSKYFPQSDIYQIGMVLYELINGPLDTNMEHYLTGEGIRNLKKKGMVYQQLGDPEKCDTINECLVELSKKSRLLEHGRKPMPYYAKKIERQISKMVSSDSSKRPENCSMLRMALSKIDLPNWKYIREDFLFLQNCNGYDYELYVEHKKRSDHVVLRKSASGQNAFRNVNAVSLNSLEDGIVYLEKTCT